MTHNLAEMVSKTAIAALSRGFPHAFVVVAQTTLMCGTTVPAFAVARWLAARGPDGRILLSATADPWVNIGYLAARAACCESALRLLTESQALAIAQDLARQPVNWSGGAVGVGKLFQGLHLSSFDRPQAACVPAVHQSERRWHMLSSGQRIVDIAGNAFNWVFDDIQGDAAGLVARAFAADSPTVSEAPGATMEHGLGWWPRQGCGWHGRALARGGSWSSQDGSGLFTVIDEKPRAERPYIGFRCTLPLYELGTGEHLQRHQRA
jgi:hypothetical protein